MDFPGAETAGNILGIFINEDSGVIEEVYPSTSGQEHCIQIKEEEALDIPLEIHHFEDEGNICYLCYHCKRTYVSFKHLKTHVKLCFFLLNPCFPLSKPVKMLVESGTGHGFDSDNPSAYRFWEENKYPVHSSSGDSTTESYEVHQASKQAENKCIKSKPHSCLNCDYRTDRPRNLKRHIMYKHNNYSFQSCQYCDFITDQLVLLKNHIKSKHITTKRHSCPYCDYRTVYCGHLKDHIMAKHSNNKPYACPHCDYRAVRQRDLKRHILSRHTNNKPHSCPHCDYRAVQSGSLKRHISSKHSFSRPHSCPHCDYRAVQRANLKNHIKSKHTN